MKKYRVEVTEILNCVVEVDAKDAEDALDAVMAMYRTCEIVLDASDYVTTEYRVRDE